jgi:threonine synthase
MTISLFGLSWHEVIHVVGCFLSVDVMNYYSTNRQVPMVSLRQAVVDGLAGDRGLYMPERIPALPSTFYDQLDQLTFSEIAFLVAEAFF